MQPVVPSSTDVDVTFRVLDATTFLPYESLAAATSGLALWYQKGPTGSVTAITEADHTNLTDAHSDGKLKHIDDGLYRLSLPDAAVPTAENEVTTWGGTATGYIILGGALVGKVTALAPTTAGRTLDVSATGEAGLDWANVGSPTTVVGLSGTTVKTATDVETDTADIQARIPAALVSGRIDASVGAIAAGAITAASIATGAVDADALAADAVTEIAAGITIPTAAAVADAVWDEATAGHATAGTTGKALADAGAAGDPWEAAVRTLTQPAASVAAAVNGTNVTTYADVTWSIALTGLGSMAARSKVWFIVYTDGAAADTEATVLIDSVSGLTRLNGATYATAADGALTFPSSTALTVTLEAAAAAQLSRGTYSYAIKMLDTGGDVTQLSHGGRLVIVQGAPQAIS